MGKMSLAWLESQIEHELERGNNPEAVRDLAALVTVRNYLLENNSKTQSAHEYNNQTSPTYHERSLDVVPTLDQIEKALGAVVVNSDADRKRVRDAMTWTKIIKGEG